MSGIGTGTRSVSPGMTDIEKVRYHIQDNDESVQLLSDDEIQYELDEADNDILAASLACAEALVARGAHKVTKKIGQTTINYSDLTANYERLVSVLQAKIQRADASFSVPQSGEVADVSNYPKAFELTDLEAQSWS
jgi:hypothetical protein